MATASHRVPHFWGFMLSVAFLFPGSSSATDYPPANHAGANLTLADGDRVWGLHEGIGILSIPTSATVHVPGYDGVTTGSVGWFEARCVQADIAGTLDASGAGFTGGGGGGGGAGYIPPTGDWHFPPTVFACGAGGVPAYSCEASKGGQGLGPSWHLETFPIKYWMQDSYSQGGAGGRGDGPGGGDGGTTVTPGQPGDYSPGGTDNSGGTAVWPGSGGGGGCGYAGGYASPGPGGGGGGCGGGVIRIIASSAFTLGTSGTLLAEGRLGANGDPGSADPMFGPISGKGGDAIPPGAGLGGNASAGSGGAGAGGGILIDLRAANTITFRTGSRISTADGALSTGHAGTLKVVHPASTPADLSGVSLTVGRLFQTTPAGVVSWREYD